MAKKSVEQMLKNANDCVKFKVKRVPTMSAVSKASGDTVVINVADFNPELYSEVGAEAAPEAAPKVKSRKRPRASEIEETGDADEVPPLDYQQLAIMPMAQIQQLHVYKGMGEAATKFKTKDALIKALIEIDGRTNK
jgi:hypothetical protein